MSNWNHLVFIDNILRSAVVQIGRTLMYLCVCQICNLSWQVEFRALSSSNCTRTSRIFPELSITWVIISKPLMNAFGLFLSCCCTVSLYIFYLVPCIYYHISIISSVYITWAVTCPFHNRFSNKNLSFGTVDIGLFPNVAPKFGISLGENISFHLLQSALYYWSLIHSCTLNCIISTSVWSLYVFVIGCWLIPWYLRGAEFTGNSKQLPTYILFENAEEVARFPEFNLQAKASIPVVTKV